MTRKKVDDRYSRDTAYPAPPRWSKLYAEHFPERTCPASRHARLIASDILRDPKSRVRQMLIDAGYEPDHWAQSIESTVVSLWKTRAELERVRNREPAAEDLKYMRKYLKIWQKIKTLANPVETRA